MRPVVTIFRMTANTGTKYLKDYQRYLSIVHLQCNQIVFHSFLVFTDLHITLNYGEVVRNLGNKGFLIMISSSTGLCCAVVMVSDRSGGVLVSLFCNRPNSQNGGV